MASRDQWSQQNPSIPPRWRRCRQCGRTGKITELFTGARGKPVVNCTTCRVNMDLAKK